MKNLVDIYPVIHVSDVARVREQVRIATRHDVSGVFLIDHDGDDRRLLDSVEAVRCDHPDLFLGVNVIHRDIMDSLTVLAARFPTDIPLNAIWTDNAGIDVASGIDPFPQLQQKRTETGWTGTHFGGIAFKYQNPVPDADLPALGELAARYVDVPTTSGAGTGHPAPITKLEGLRAGLGDHPLAVASGVSASNIQSICKNVDYALVSTGINNESDEIDESKLAELLDRARSTEG
ncbi:MULTISPECIES: hypothetical protein [Rhodococcus]|uniref:hypothetical protein n=1 Tax=Rhodococcus TaxID=1827 RepID=UPI00097590DF|nr:MULTISPECIES: hypothetical protein [Rhodococcus]OMQ23884.1 hypothetical protein BK799_31565 [Rhodococcus sp. D-1]